MGDKLFERKGEMVFLMKIFNPGFPRLWEGQGYVGKKLKFN